MGDFKLSARSKLSPVFLSMRDLFDLIHFVGEYYFNRPVHGFFQVSCDRPVSEYPLILLKRAQLKIENLPSFKMTH